MAIYQQIPLKDLEVNLANDRHGDVGSESAAIEWLLVNKTDKMKELLQNIAHKKVIFEEPLVMKKAGEDKYTVYDGNRRVTCLKLLHGLAPNSIQNPLENKIAAIRADNEFAQDAYIECRVENDINVINDILELRHIPGNSGAGQLKWDGHEKENFLERTGKSQKINFAREVNRLLIDDGYLNPEDRIPLSTFNRLFSSNEMKRRAGFDIEDNEIRLINERDTSYKAMARIAKDMIAGQKTLDDVWDNKKKSDYLDELEQEGILPSAKNRLKSTEPAKFAIEEGTSVSMPKKPDVGPRQRDYLLSTDLPAPQKSVNCSAKFCLLFYELQNTLRFSQHLIAISISFRAFIEILTNSYLRTHGLDESGTLSNKIERSFVDMQSRMKMPEETRAFVSKLSEANEYFSINTLHKVAHNDMQISENDLRSYVNNLDAYLREAIRCINESKEAVAA